jgi:hypothetical protein
MPLLSPGATFPAVPITQPGGTTPVLPDAFADDLGLAHNLLQHVAA